MLSFFKWYRKWRKGYWIKHDTLEPWQRVNQTMFDQMKRSSFHPIGRQFEEYS